MTGPVAAFDVMQADPVDRDEFALGRIPAFGPSRERVIGQRGGRQHRGAKAENPTGPHGRGPVRAGGWVSAPTRVVRDHVGFLFSSGTTVAETFKLLTTTASP